MVNAHCTTGESLGSSIRLLGEHVAALPDPALATRAHDFVAAFATGYADALRQRTLVEQQRITVAALTARQDAEEARWASERRFAALFADAAIGISVGTVDGEILDVNRALCDMFGYTKQQMLRQSISDFMHPDDAEGTWEHVRDLISGDRDHFRIEKPYSRRDGTQMWADLVVSLVRDQDGTPRYMVAMVEDITERHELQARLHHQALHDPLTDLPNRTMFVEALATALTSATREHEIGLCYLDLDGFKAVNDTLGHEMGDRLLQTIAHRISDGLGRVHLVARMGGDEFVILVDSAEAVADVVAVADEALRAVRRSVQIDDHAVSVSASIGIVTTSSTLTTAGDLMKAADATLYWAKSAGRNRWALFDPDRYAREVTQYELARTLPAALDRGELFMEYQPMMSLADGSLRGVEALVRWQHPQWGRLGPSEFIPVAEETGMITKLGLWVLRIACAQAYEWNKRHPGNGLVMSVNLAPQQVNESTIVEYVSGLLTEFELEPATLQLEITESAIMSTSGQPLKTLHALADLGVRIAIDDFGTGYSNLAYLRTLPVHALKLAGPFVTSLHDSDLASPEDHAVVGTLISLAHTLGLTVTAEGVETVPQVDALERLDCDIIQGFLYAEAEPPESISARLATPGPPAR